MRSFGTLAVVARDGCGTGGRRAGARRAECCRRPRRKARQQVLVLYSTRRDAQIATVGDRELPRILEQGLGGPLDYYSEFIDLARFPDPEYQAGFRDFLRLKYAGYRFDLVIAMQDVALEFRGELSATSSFPELRSSSSRTHVARPRPQNSTGIVAPLYLRRHARSGRGVAARCPQRVRRERRVNARQGVRSGGAGTAPAVRILGSRSPTCPDCRRGARDAAGAAAAQIHRLLPAGQSRWRRRERPPAGIPGPPGGSRQRAGLLLGRLGDGPRHRRRQPSRSEGAGRRTRRHLALRVLRGEPADSIPLSSPRSERRTRSTGASCGAGASARRVPRAERSSGSGSPRPGTATRSTSSARSPAPDADRR